MSLQRRRERTSPFSLSLVNFSSRAGCRYFFGKRSFAIDGRPKKVPTRSRAFRKREKFELETKKNSNLNELNCFRQLILKFQRVYINYAWYRKNLRTYLKTILQCTKNSCFHERAITNYAYDNIKRSKFILIHLIEGYFLCQMTQFTKLQSSWKGHYKLRLWQQAFKIERELNDYLRTLTK